MNLLLVDDEPLLIKSLLLIDWQSLGFTEVYTAYTASQALKLISQNEIDLLISDIQMPGLTGLELYEQVIPNHPNMLCIYISGYEKFSFAQHALKLHAIDFLTKPVRDEELLSAVTIAVSKITARNKMDKQLAERKLISRILNKQELAEHLFQIPFFNTNNSQLQLLVLEYRQTDILLENLITSVKSLIDKSSSKYFESFFLSNFHNQLIFILKPKQSISDAIWDLLLNNIQLLLQQTLFLTVKLLHFKDPVNLLDLPETLIQLRNRLYHLPSNGKSIFTFSEHLQLPQIQYTISELHVSPTFQELFDIEDFGKIYKKLDLIQQEVLSHHLDSQAVRDEVTFTFINSLSYLISIRNSTVLKNIRDALILVNDDRTFKSFSQLTEYLKKITHEFQEESLKKNTFSLVERINQLVKGNIEQNVTASWLAEALNYHPAYLSKLYKEKTGMNLKDLIFQEKINYAKRLLQNPEIKIYEVSERVGFNNVSYFSAQFKNKTGMTPLVYRNLTLKYLDHD